MTKLRTCAPTGLACVAIGAAIALALLSGNAAGAPADAAACPPTAPGPSPFVDEQTLQEHQGHPAEPSACDGAEPSPRELIALARAGDIEAARILYGRTFMCFEAERNLESLAAYAPFDTSTAIGRMLKRGEEQNLACSRFSAADITHGREAMEIAAFNGDASAQGLLLHSLSLPQTSDLAASAAQVALRERLFHHLEERAAQGDAGSMEVLGFELAFGTGREKDPVRALGYLLAAEYLGGATTVPDNFVPSPRGVVIEQLTSRLTPDELERAETTAVELIGDP